MTLMKHYSNNKKSLISVSFALKKVDPATYLKNNFYLKIIKLMLFKIFNI